MRALVSLMFGFMISLPVFALGVGELSNQEAARGLKEALLQSTSAAVARLGVTDGFLGNKKVKIPLPGPLQKAEGLMRMMGMGKQADELVITMNRAAEAAVPEARTLLVAAVKKMTWQDARDILTGGNDAATQYFKKTSSPALTVKFLPIVKQATDKVGLAQQYNGYAAQGARLGLIDKDQAKVENYVTQKTLDGLFFMMAEEENAIRNNPLGQASSILQKVFGAVSK